MNIHSARLISLTQPVLEVIEELGINSPEGLTAWIARVSNPKNQSNENIAGLLRYCIKHGHYSILEHCVATFEVTTTRDIAMHIIRHWSMRFQQLSGRYAEQDILGQLYEVPQMRGNHPTNRQASIVEFEIEPYLQQEVEDLLKKTENLYKRLLEVGVAKECARRILPECTITKMYMTGNLRDFIFYLKARTYEGAQLEHQQVANSIKAIFEKEFPIISEAALT